MKRKDDAAMRLRVTKINQQKLQERTAVLYSRELERWNTRPLRELAGGGGVY